jgi:hypothetical protein
MRRLLALVAVTFIVISANAQEQKVGKLPGRSSFFAELGGPGVLFSANLDTRFKKSIRGWGGRAGLGFVTASEYKYTPPNTYEWNDASAITIPVQVNYIFGKDASPHAFEVGAGIHRHMHLK